MSEFDEAATDTPTASVDGSTETSQAPPDGQMPREALEARAKLAALAAGTASPEESAATDEPAADTPDASTDEPTESKALADLKAKYGGDLNKMAESYWEGTKEASTLSRELEAMRESIEALRNERQTAIPEFEPAPEDIPSNEDLQFVTDDIATFESDITAAKTDMDAIIDRSERLKADIHRAEGRVETAEDPDQKARLQAEAKELVNQYNSEARQFKALKAEITKLERDKKVKEREKTSIERRIEAERSSVIKAQADRKAYAQEQGQAFNSSIEEAFKATGLPESERALYGETITAKVGAYLRSLGNAPALSTEALIKVTKQEAEKIARLHGLGQRQSFTDASKAKLAANAALRTPPANGTGVGNKPPKFNSAEEEGKWMATQARLRLAAAASRARTQ